jgi:hypothetical protein
MRRLQVTPSESRRVHLPVRKFVTNKKLRAAAVGKNPNAGHVPSLKKQFKNHWNVVGSRHRDIVIRAAD